MDQSIETRIETRIEARIEARIEVLEKEVKRLQAREAIANLMAHYEVLHNQKNMALHPMDFAMETDDVSVQVADSEVYYGPEGVRQLFGGTYNITDYQGIMLIHYLTTPFIEVAQDGQTARGLWWSPGIETVKRTPESEPEAVWCFGAYANDFILENGVWKIWHMRWISTIKCPYLEGWADQRTYYTRTAGHSQNPPPTHNPYSKTYIQEAIPMGPKPYETWDDQVWYLAEESR